MWRNGDGPAFLVSFGVWTTVATTTILIAIKLGFTDGGGSDNVSWGAALSPLLVAAFILGCLRDVALGGSAFMASCSRIKQIGAQLRGDRIRSDGWALEVV